MARKASVQDAANRMPEHVSRFTDFDIDLFKAGVHYGLYDKLGAHVMDVNGVRGTYFAVWAPNAEGVAVIGNFNGWNGEHHAMHVRWDNSGIWELFIPGIGQGEYYKYVITGPDGYTVQKSDPCATHFETSPQTASIVWGRGFKWGDKKWMNERRRVPQVKKAIAIYEVHIGSWRRADGAFLTYREIAAELPAYCAYMGFTHVEFLPVAEHPFYASWGYQGTGYFAPTSRYGTPQDFMFLVNELHRAGIGVILDWVPSHFPDDAHGLGFFDGTHLYEHADPQKGFHPDWHSYLFNMGRNEVRAFLISNALYWLDQFHIDGLRVDAVASMLYLDYSRKAGQWTPNEFGGRENLESVAFLKAFNDAVHERFPEVMTIAEESTAWPGVTKPTNEGGLGFDLKWMMGWMNDTLAYFSKDPIYRRHHHDALTFNIFYAFSEHFLLPLSHDEVVHGKYSLLKKMPGDEWQQFANLRLLYGYMYGHPGAKLIFMGGEFAQSHEWRHDHSLDWHENNNSMNKGVQELLRDLNTLCRLPAMTDNFSHAGYEWLHFDDRENSVISWMRKGSGGECLIFICNFTPVIRRNYRIGMPASGYYEEVLNSDDVKYGGGGVHNKQLISAPIARHGRVHSLSLLLPPLATVVLRRVPDDL